ncbi:ParB-like nuclease domain [Cedecea neteri]|uniref:ParB-like nuclease domain n=1 Tax=Cedecea neteri TaxID=158822 RepID=A0A2X2T547_9ENTR|nr:ParB-like nuclease domain [Cedecea neteri]
MLNTLLKQLDNYLASFESDESKVAAMNEVKKVMHQHSPFKKEPVDCVLWVREGDIIANDYNPNVMAPVELSLLKHSIETDGYTQPIVVTRLKDKFQVVDGFHRIWWEKHHLWQKKRINGFLPITVVNLASSGEAECIAVTVRHNRARGKHQITAMSDVVRDLSRLGWDDLKIGAELGMDADEVLRLKQISGLSELFSSEKFSDAWTIK